MLVVAVMNVRGYKIPRACFMDEWSGYLTRCGNTGNYTIMIEDRGGLYF